MLKSEVSMTGSHDDYPNKPRTKDGSSTQTETPKGEVKTPETPTSSIKDSPIHQAQQLTQLKRENDNLQRDIATLLQEIKASETTLTTMPESGPKRDKSSSNHEKLIKKRNELQKQLRENLQAINQIMLESNEYIQHQKRYYDMTLVSTSKTLVVANKIKDEPQLIKDALVKKVEAKPGEENQTTIICEQDRTQQQEDIVSGRKPKRTEDVGLGFRSIPSKFYLYSEIKPAEGSSSSQWDLVEMDRITPEERRGLDQLNVFPKYWNKDQTKPLHSYESDKYRLLYELAEKHNPLLNPQRREHNENDRAFNKIIESSNRYLSSNPYTRQHQLTHERQSEISPHAGGPRGDNPNAHKHLGLDPEAASPRPSLARSLSSRFLLGRGGAEKKDEHNRAASVDPKENQKSTKKNTSRRRGGVG